MYSSSPPILSGRLTSRRRWLTLFAGEFVFSLNGQAAGAALRAAVYDVPPYGFRSNSGATAGVLVDWFQELALVAKLNIAVALTPLARVVQSIVQGHMDMAVLIDGMPLPSHVQALGTIGAMQLGVWVPIDSQLRTKADLAGRRIAVLRGGSAEYFASNQAGAVVQPLSSIGAMVSMLRLRRVDALLLTEHALREYLAKTADQEFLLLTRRVLKMAVPLRLYVHDHVGLPALEKLTSAVEVMSAGQRYEALLASFSVALPPVRIPKPGQ